MAETDSQLASLFLAFSRNKLLGQYWPRLRDTVASLSEDQVWWRPNESSNSIGNLILHLNGNVYQWLVASFNKEDDLRDRPQEFSQRSLVPASELLESLGNTMARSEAVLTRLTAADLLAPYDIQGYHVRGLDAVYQVIEHFGLHYGQIIYIAKSLTGRDLGFYKDLSATGRAS
jgi:uncharacterized damage-inducible protein DinB